MPSNQKQITEQAKFTYSPLLKAFEKQTKAFEDQGKKQISTIKEQGKQINIMRLLKIILMLTEVVCHMKN